MSKEGSVAPKERVNIRYKPATTGAEEVELPLKIMALGDYTGRDDDTPLEERKSINIDKDNFNDVMASHNLGVNISVKDKLTGKDNGSELGLSLKFKSMKDFSPEGVLEQVPQLKQLMNLRESLVALKSPLGNIPAFRKQLNKVLNDEESRKHLLTELGLDKKGDGSDQG